MTTGSGRFNQKISLKTPDRQKRDDGSIETVGYVEYARPWAKVRFLRGDEKVEDTDLKEVARTQVEIEVWYRNDVKMTDVVDYRGDRYDITNTRPGGQNLRETLLIEVEKKEHNQP